MIPHAAMWKLPLLVVVVGLVLVSLASGGRRGCHKIHDTRLLMKSVEQALILFQAGHTESCPRSLAQLRDEKYLTRVPMDPWGTALGFQCPGRHDRDGADLWSAGRDRRWGTEDDLYSWTRQP